MTNTRKLTPTIGLEIHVELSTKSKMFCGCPADHFGKKPNTQTCPVCLGLPGALPVPQKKAVEWTIMIGLALHSSIARRSKFDRKHYFYPDLPKGYQISQYDEPLCTGGSVETSEGGIRITRVHLEEDTGKLVHKKVNGRQVSLVDFNRSGVPLVEIVTEPEIRSASQAKELAQSLRKLLRHLGVSDCDMEKGSMRLEANVSLTRDPMKLADYKVEIKNINSFRFLERAISDELGRQESLLAKGTTPKQETRGWDEALGKTRSQRFKETASDYRYFPEPDIPPMVVSRSDIEKLKTMLPEMQADVSGRWIEKFGIRKDYARILVSSEKSIEFFEEAFAIAQREGVKPNEIASEVVNKRVKLAATTPAGLVRRLIGKTESKVVKKVTLMLWIDQSVKELPQAVSDYKAGKTASISALIGRVMQVSGGKADAKSVRSLLEETLKNR